MAINIDHPCHICTNVQSETYDCLSPSERIRTDGVEISCPIQQKSVPMQQISWNMEKAMTLRKNERDKRMTELELQQYLLCEYPQENARCEWKEFKNLKNSFCGDEKDDVISYVSAIANMEGGHLVIGVKDKTLEIVGTDISRLTFNGQPANPQSATFKLTEQCTYLSSEGLSIEEFVTDDTQKRVWIIHIPKHLPRRPVLAHKKAWQRIEDSLVELTAERMNVILDEPISGTKDWSAEIVPDVTVEDLDEVAIAKARMMFKKVHSRIPAAEVNAWDVKTFLGKCGLTKNGGITRAVIILLGKYDIA